MKRRLCFVIPSMSRGGAERVMSILTNYAAHAGHEVYLILLFDSRVEYELASQVNVIRISDMLSGQKGMKGKLETISALRKTVLEIKPHLTLSFLTTCNLYTALALRNTRIPLVVSERNDPKRECTSRLKQMLRNICYRSVDGIVFQTESARAFFDSRIQSHSTVIPNPVKTNLPLIDGAVTSNKIVAAARLMPQKNYPMMLRAFQRFLASYPDYTLHIFGDGELKTSLLQLAEELSISERVVFEGNVLDWHERARDAKMFILTSDYEGISNSLLEALAMGLPSVSTDCPCGGSGMLIEDGVSGLLTPVGDEVAFSLAMEKIAENEMLAHLLSKNAIRVRETFSEDVIVGRYFDYFERVVNQNQRLER